VDIQLILVPYDCGHDRKRMGLGPERIMEAGLKPLFSRMNLRFDCQEIALESPFPAEIAAAFELCRSVSRAVAACRERGVFPIVLSGNCSIAVGTVSGCGPAETKVVWFDAHGEATTPDTTTSGFLDGMGISILTGQCWQSMARSIPGFASVGGSNIVLFGARDLEDAERKLLDRIGVIRLNSPQQLREHLGATTDISRSYVHFDLDVLDPSVARGNQWATPGGIDVETLNEAFRESQNRTTISALGIASYNPAVDDGNRALAAVVSVVESIVGERRT
jgi:arginase